jgi:pimeloyl-ACP methyl ester carboxylesterase
VFAVTLGRIAEHAPTELALASGAAARMRGPRDGRVAICLGGGVAAAVPGIWNASLEWLADRLELRRPDLGLLEVRYRIRSWRDLPRCIEDAAAALDAAAGAGARGVTLVGFSMGGSVAVSVAAHPLVDQVVGLAPWLPDRLELAPLRGRRLDVLHGSLDRWFPGVPGVPASLSRSAAERAQALGIPTSYRLVRGGVHGIAARTRFGLVRFPKAGEWLEGVDAVLLA